MKTLKHDIAIIDYQLSNLFSVEHACQACGFCVIITSSPKELIPARVAILPGVGAFPDAMRNLKRLHLIKPIQEYIRSKRPFMGVCLGMQLLFSESEEFGRHRGLDIIQGTVRKFPSCTEKRMVRKIPQIGWNSIYPRQGLKKYWNHSPLSRINPTTYMYFIHSYYVQPEDSSVILSKTMYDGFEYCSSILKDKLFAVQFHPEKSGSMGLQIYKKFLQSYVV